MSQKIRLKSEKPPTLKAKPGPELIAPGDWKIVDMPIQSDGTTNSCCSRASSQMRVPLELGDHAQTVRLHELGHVKWSPDSPPSPGSVGLRDMNSILVCEDYRINRLLDAYMSPEWDPDTYTGHDGLKQQFQEAVSQGKCLAAAQILMSASGTGAESSVRIGSYVPGEVEEAVQGAKAYIDKESLNFNRAVQAAIYLEMCFAPPDPDPEPEDEIEAAVTAGLKGMDGDSDDEDSPKKAAEAAEKFGEEEGLTPVKSATVPTTTSKDGGDPDWGRMVIKTPPRPIDVLRQRVGRRSRQVLRSGTKLNKPHRILSDQRVWKKRVRFTGASVLLDQSGSMGCTAEQLNQLVETCPAMITAAYAGFDGSGGLHEGVGGYLRILVKDGKRVADDDIRIGIGGNGVDFPALEWLAKQDEPRLWISDGCVIPGISGMNHHLKGKAQCAELCRQARIIRLDNIEMGLDFLKRLL